MVVALVGISHKTAPVEVRERLAFSRADLAALLPRLKEQFGASVVLSTCNRTEVYVTAAPGSVDPRRVAAFLSDYKGFAVAEEIDGFYFLDHAAVVRHLFRVAAGIESMVLGEAQILGQVRDAVIAAERAGTVDPLLVRLFQSAIAGGRRVRTTTGIVHYAGSASAAAVRLARDRFGDLGTRTVLVISAGEAGKLTARSLAEAGAGSILVSSRTFSRALNLATQLDGTAVPFDQLAVGLAAADIVISATGARGFQIDRPMLERAMRDRPHQPLLLIDLAVPRDVDPAAAGVAGVTLYDIDDLQAGVDDAAEGTLRVVEQVEALVEDEVRRFLAWWQNRRVVPMISALRHQAEAIRRAELAKTFGRLPNLSSEEQRRIEALTSAIVNKLLHQPIMRLKSPEEGERYLDVVRDLFALESVGAD